MSHVLCLGLGYSAEAIARRLLARGWSVAGTTTRPERLAAMAALGIEGFVFDGHSADAAAANAALQANLAKATHIVVSIPPGTGGDPTLAALGTALRTAPRLAWIGYLSTVGVYGDHHGEWVDEMSELRPVSARSRERVAAERAWLALDEPGRRQVAVFRLSGIYGPGRSAIDTLRAGTARRIVKPGQVFNRIHVDDIAASVVAAIDRPELHAIYNVTDDEPAPPQDVVAFAAATLGVPVPPDVPFERAELSPMGRSFYGENKRVRNWRLRRDLGVALAYPTYREGLRALAAAARAG
jgi:nucleoside-diphosphate-sugar epimerase